MRFMQHKLVLVCEIDFTSATFKRSFIKCFEVYPEEVTFTKEYIEINLPWITPAAVAFSLMHKSLRQVSIIKSGKEILIRSKMYRLTKILYRIIFLVLSVLGLILSFQNGQIIPLLIFVGFPFSVLAIVYFIAKRSPVWRFNKLLKSFRS
jgi:hypothetical protein